MAGETVWWLPRQIDGVDEHGNPNVSWPDRDDPESVRIDGASVAGRVRLDNELPLPGREAVIEPVNVFTLTSYDISSVDRMHIRGEVYEVVGEPFLWVHNTTQRVRGMQIVTKRVEG